MTQLAPQELITQILIPNKKRKTSSAKSTGSDGAPTPQTSIQPAVPYGQPSQPSNLQEAFQTFRALASSSSLSQAFHPKHSALEKSKDKQPASTITTTGTVAPHPLQPTHFHSTQPIPTFPSGSLKAPSKTASLLHGRMMRRLVKNAPTAPVYNGVAFQPIDVPSRPGTIMKRLYSIFQSSNQGTSDCNIPLDRVVTEEFDKEIAQALTSTVGRYMGLSQTDLNQSPGLKDLVTRNMQWFHNTPDWLKLAGLVTAKKLNRLVGSSSSVGQIADNCTATSSSGSIKIFDADETAPDQGPLAISSTSSSSATPGDMSPTEKDKDDWQMIDIPAISHAQVGEANDAPQPPRKRAKKAIVSPRKKKDVKGKTKKTVVKDDAHTPPPSPLVVDEKTIDCALPDLIDD